MSSNYPENRTASTNPEARPEATPEVTDRTSPVVIVGAGPAGLATSRHLKTLGVDHVLLERDSVGASWRSARWDSFRLITPAWSVRLPERAQAVGEDEDGFLTKQQLVELFEAYARGSDLPVRAGVDVRSLRRTGNGYVLATSEGDWSADAVVIASGALRLPRIPAALATTPAGVTALHATEYRRPEQLAPGAVLVVGSGQSGAKIADELCQAGRRVFLATGSAGGVPRRYRGQDVFVWLRDTGSLAQPTEQAPPQMRRAAMPNVSDADGGCVLALRKLARDGVTLLGHLTGSQGDRLFFADDLEDNLHAAEVFAARFRTRVEDYLRDHPERQAPAAPTEARADADEAGEPGEFALDDGHPAAPTELGVAEENISTILWCTGMRPDTGWLPEDLLDEAGVPRHQHGATPVPGVFAVGFPWLTHRASSLLYGMGTDAAHVAEEVRRYLGGGA
jgi:putative flavoprotein involved in K+ transport